MLYYEIRDILGDEDGYGRREIDIPDDTNASEALEACKRDFADCVARGDCNGLSRGAYIDCIYSSEWSNYCIYKHDVTEEEKDAAKNIKAGFDDLGDAIADGKATIAFWSGKISAFRETLDESAKSGDDEVYWDMEKFARARILAALERLMINTVATKILLEKKAQK